MNRNYIFLTLIMLVLAVGTFFLKKPEEHVQIEPQDLLREITGTTRYISTDQVAKWIIQKDPSLLLIDVRMKEEFDEYSLPGSVNIPLDSMLTTESLPYYSIPGTRVVFVSNDDIQADQAWVLSRRMGYKSNYVMTGGLNRWMETIIQPEPPAETGSSEEYATYTFRKGAQLYFTGAGSEPQEAAKTEITVARREKTTVASGGC